MHQHLATHRGHSGEVGDSFPFNQFEGPRRIPLVGQHQFGARDRGGMQQAVVGRDVEERRRSHEYVLLVRIRWRRCIFTGFSTSFCFCSCRDARHEREIEQVMHRTAVCELCSLGEPGRAGGVEDARIVIRVDVSSGESRWRRCRVDDIVPVIGALREAALGADGDEVHCMPFAQLRENRNDSLEAFAVGDEHLRGRIGKSIFHLIGGPPGIHPDTGGADRHDGPVSKHPFGIVTHRQRDTIARANAVHIAQMMCKGTDDGIRLGVRVALVFEHDVVAVAVASR